MQIILETLNRLLINTQRERSGHSATSRRRLRAVLSSLDQPSKSHSTLTTMIARLVVLLAGVSLVACQAEQSIFAQFLYPPVVHADVTKPPVTTTTKVTATTEPTLQREGPAVQETTERHLEVLPILARSRRSGFSREALQGGNDALVSRLRSNMADPNWVPEIVPRFKGDKVPTASKS